MTIDLPVFAQLRPLNALASPLPLEHTAIQARVTGLAASVTVSQRFRNPLTEKTDLEYLFPLPSEAAVIAFELRAGERVIRASVQEIEQARQQYERARQQGQRASLLESRRPNLFALQLANLQPGEFIEAVTTYQQRLTFTAGQVDFVFPMGLTPKYHRPVQADEAAGVDAPLTLDLAQVGAVEISLEVEAGLQSGDPLSPSHPFLITRQSATCFSVRLDGPHLPNKDFVLRWQVPGDAIQFPAWQTPGEAGYFLATFLPPEPDPAAAPIPREYVFVLDRSGSMSGDPIRQAVNALRACLRSLNPQDTFAILLFDDRLEWLNAAEMVTQAAVERADQRLGRVDGRGGTEILPALAAALSLPQDPQRARMVIFLTDGAVSAEAQALKQVREQMDTARLFSFGVGPSVNRAFLQQLARLGRGQAEFIGLDEDIEDVILRFQDRIAFPLLTNLSLQAENGSLWDVYPAQLPDLYAGCPLEVVGRYRGEGRLPVTLVARGERLGAPLEMRARLTELSPDPALLPRLWARARVDDLGEQSELGLKPEHATRAEIIALALEHSLLTRYTAFLAVDNETTATAGKATFIQVAHPLPEGLEPAGFINAPASAAYSPAPAFKMLASQPDLVLPSFLRSRRDGKAKLMQVSEVTPEAQPEPVLESSTSTADAALILRELARTQKLDGSWNDNAEDTAAALLAFVRNGQTTLTGHFRKQVGRAFTWLAQATASGFTASILALALRELAEATQAPAHLAAAENAAQTLLAPGSDLEAAVLAALRGEPGALTSQKRANILDDLRLAAVTGAKGILISPKLLENELGRALAAGLV
jgi:Ca-activated chloride channel family protein